MSQHSSLKTSRVGGRHRTVLKRYERFFALKEKGILKNGDSVFGMPKLKILRTKIKKEKAEAKPEEAQVGVAPGTGAAPTVIPPKEPKPKAEAKPKTEKEKK
jgi:small basic protein (TIGR04137 family)